MFRKNKQQKDKYDVPVVVAEYRYINDAEYMKAVLESNGIRCMVLDSSVALNSINTKIVVKKLDAEAAIKIINEKH